MTEVNAAGLTVGGDLRVGYCEKDRDVEERLVGADAADHAEIHAIPMRYGRMLAEFINLTHVDVAHDLQLCGVRVSSARTPRVQLMHARVGGDMSVKEDRTPRWHAGNS